MEKDLLEIENTDLTNDEICQYLANTTSLSFLNDEEENCYTDDNLKVKY